MNDPLLHYCAAQGWQGACRGPLELHHIVSFGMARGNKEVRRLLKTNPPELTIFLCKRHHERFGRTRALRKICLQHKIDEFGKDWMAYVIDSLPWKVKHESLTLKGLMS